MIKSFFLFPIILLFIFSACEREENETGSSGQNTLSGDIVKNPGTLQPNNAQKLPELTFETLDHDFGKISEGATVEFDFRFTNTGEAPLIISEVKASCGCTTPSWPKGVIKPGSSDAIKVAYNSQGRPGQFGKGITVISNTYPNQTILKISGVVFPN
ncbi:MAG: DUF1573 domain-containing protein [Chitinophagales bacterium]